jgi:hypothetical protein
MKSRSEKKIKSNTEKKPDLLFFFVAATCGERTGASGLFCVSIFFSSAK